MLTVKKLLFTSLALLCAGYAIAFTKNPAFFYLYLIIAVYLVCFLLFLLLLTSIRGKIYQIRKRLFWPVILACFLLFIFLFKLSTVYFLTKIIVSPQEQLESLPYLTWVPAKGNLQYSGVIKNKPESYKGLNIYNSDNSKVIRLIDMQGNVLHSWLPEINEKEGFQYCQMNKDGSILAIVKDKYLICFDWDSKIRWQKKGMIHHDIRTVENGDIYSLSRKDEIVWYCGIPMPITNDYIVLYSNENGNKKEISVYKLLESEIPFEYFLKTYYRMLRPYVFLETIRKAFEYKRYSWSFIWLYINKYARRDILHSNSIQVIERDVPGLCKKNDMLVSFCFLNLIAIIDARNEKVIWKWGPGNLIKQHHATLLENNNILVFDNGSIKERRYSRIIELNPFTKQIVWEYRSEPRENFFSETRGACQRLPNGNTLITNSDSGHVFEVTKNGEITWEFYNPDRDMERKMRGAIYRFMRIINPEDYPILATLE
jgi:hypothetical protein